MVGVPAGFAVEVVSDIRVLGEHLLELVPGSVVHPGLLHLVHPVH